ncbi:hypothetical protein QT333_01315 [Escherichia coli]|nr:hypothetical protein [Escherichia coli]
MRQKRSDELIAISDSVGNSRNPYLTETTQFVSLLCPRRFIRKGEVNEITEHFQAFIEEQKKWFEQHLLRLPNMEDNG